MGLQFRASPFTVPAKRWACYGSYMNQTILAGIVSIVFLGTSLGCGAHSAKEPDAAASVVVGAGDKSRPDEEANHISEDDEERSDGAAPPKGTMWGDSPSRGVGMDGSTIAFTPDKQAIQRVIRGKKNEMRACYEGQLKSNPTLEGKLVIRFVIAADGTVASVQEENTTLSDEVMKACVMNVIRGLFFPDWKSGVISIVYPFVFRAVEIPF